MDRVKRYSSDLNNEEWNIVSPLIPLAKSGGRKRSVNVRAIMDGIFYFIRTGCQWRLLPKDFPPWGTIHYYYRRWRLDGILFKIHEHLRKLVRIKSGKDEDTTIGIIDSQSVKTTEKRGCVAGMLQKRLKEEKGIFLLIV